MSNLNQTFSGLWVALVTPFTNGQVDHSALCKLVKKLASEGAAGFVPCGSTGEAAALDKSEQLAVLETVAAASSGLPVMMGASGYNLPYMVQWVQSLGELPKAQRPAGVLVTAPIYIRPSQAGLLHWFRTIADASAVPTIIYDIPYRTGVHITLETLRELARHANVVAIKDCGGDAIKTQHLIAEGPLQVLAGEDAQIFSSVALGAAGAISAAANVLAAPLASVMQMLKNQQLQQARQAWADTLPKIEALYTEPNPALIKAVLAHQGQMSGELRAPMMVATAAGTETALKAFAAN